MVEFGTRWKEGGEKKRKKIMMGGKKNNYMRKRLLKCPHLFNANLTWNKRNLTL